MKLTWAVVLVCSALIALSLLLSGWAFYARHRDSAEAWHKVICFSERETLKSHISKKRERRIIRFYNQILVLVDAAPCPPPAHT